MEFNFEMMKDDVPVKTKGGCQVRILCSNALGEYPIVGLIIKDITKEEETLARFTKEGKADTGNEEDNLVTCKIEEKLDIWIARDMDGSLFLFQHQPVKHSDYFKEETDSMIEIPQEKFPFVTWENSPKKISLKYATF